MQILKQVQEQLARIQFILSVRKLPTKSLAIHEVALASLGKKLSGEKAPVEFGCAEAVNAIAYQATGQEIGGNISTYRMYHALQDTKRYQRVTTPDPGDIVISPTGYGSGAMPNGHVGIVSTGGVIMSNNSATGMWEKNYTLSSWRARYVHNGGFPMYYYKVI